MFEELEREVTVLRTQNGFLEKQLRGCMNELELHKRHVAEFKSALEMAVSSCGTHPSRARPAAAKRQGQRRSARTHRPSHRVA